MSDQQSSLVHMPQFGVSITLRSGLPSYVLKYRQCLQPTRHSHHELSESVHRLSLSSGLAQPPNNLSWHNTNNWVPFP